MKRWLKIVALFTLSIGWLDPAAAAPLITKSEAESIARQQSGGQILKTELIYPPDGKPFYRVKIITNGQIRTIQVDAVRGE